jgi:hypothetical protein
MPSSNRQMGADTDTTPPRHEVPRPLKMAAIVLRSLFLIILLAVVARVSLPQSENIWTIYDEPVDAVRLVLGLLVSAWIVYHLFRLPRDEQAYRTWAYLGIALVPLMLVVLFALR